MAYLEIKEGPLKGTHFAISGKVTVGRNVTNLLHINDASVSRQHAEIWHREKLIGIFFFESGYEFPEDSLTSDLFFV